MVPPPKASYPDPSTEPRSRTTQAAADRHLSGNASISAEAAEIDRKRGK